MAKRRYTEEASGHKRLYWKTDRELIERTLERAPLGYLASMMNCKAIKRGLGAYLKYDGYQFLVHRNNLQHAYLRRINAPIVVRIDDKNLDNLDNYGLTPTEYRYLDNFRTSKEYKKYLEDGWGFYYARIERKLDKAKIHISLCKGWTPSWDKLVIKSFDYEFETK